MAAKRTSLYAAYRADLAYQRMEDWRLEAIRLEDRADMARSKSVRTRLKREAERAYKNADRAAQDFVRWQEEAERLIAREEKRRRPRTKKEEPPPKRKVYEYILKVNYRPGRKRQERHHHVWWDVRFRKVDGSRATEREVAYAVRRLHLGDVPPGWEVVTIAWDRGTRPSNDAEPSRTGDLMEALGQLGATLDNRGGMRTARDGSFVGNNYTVGEEEIEE